MTHAEFLTQLSRDGKGPVGHPGALGLLLERASAGQVRAFLDACFEAKFLIRSQEVMRRIGQGAEGFDAMAAEFQAGIGRLSTLLRTVAADAPDEARDRFLASYLAVDAGALSQLLSLCGDLARIKNWEVDGRPLPFLPSSVTKASIHPSTGFAMNDLLRSTRLALALFVLLLIVDGPFSILGWIIAFVIAGLLIAVEFVAARIRKEPGA